VSRDKLMSIPAFAWTYGKYWQAKDWLQSVEAWQTTRHWVRLAQCVVRGYVRKARASHKLERVPLRGC